MILVNRKVNETGKVRDMNTAPLNESISHGTLRDEDLVEAFMGLLEYIDPIAYVKAREIEEDYDHDCSKDDLSDHYSWFINEYLFDKLNEYSPEGYYFGAHPGDGSDFGFWEVESDDI